MSKLVAVLALSLFPILANAEIYKIKGLEFEDFFEVEHAMSKDGKFSFYSRENNLYRLDLATNITEIVSDTYLTNLTVSDDGSRVAFIRTFKDNPSPDKNFIVMNLKTLDVHAFNIGDLSYVPRAKISPNGKVLFVAHRGEDGMRSEFYDVDSKKLIMSNAELTGTVSFLENEDQVAFVQGESRKGFWVHTYNLREQKEVSKILLPLDFEKENLYNIGPCRVSLNGETVACDAQHTRDEDQHYDIIYATIAEGLWKYANVNEKDKFVGDAMDIMVNADGSKIFYQLFVSSGVRLVEQDVGSGQISYLTGDIQVDDCDGFMWDLTVSNDGNQIAFISDLKNILPDDTKPHVSLYIWKR